MGKRKDLRGQTFGTLYCESYAGDGRWNVRCTKCGVIKDIRGWDLTSGHVKSCGVCSRFIDITGQTFGEWKVISYAGNRKWNCVCSCNKEGVVSGRDLRSGKSKSCGHGSNGFKDITGQQFGDWEVLEYIGNKKWKCRCTLCNSIHEVEGSKLRTGQSVRCASCAQVIDITGKRFGDWEVLKYCRDSKGYWLCKCHCGCNTIRQVSGYSLKSGKSTGCGNRGKTPAQVSVFSDDILLSKLLLDMKSKLGRKPTSYEVADALGVNYNSVNRRIKDNEVLKGLIKVGNNLHSNKEKDLIDYINKLYSEIEIGNRKLLDGKEVDIYIPKHKLAIEFNGDYWHSDKYKDAKYHQSKTLECIKLGIRVINIFEYEWEQPELREKILRIIADKLCDTRRVVDGNLLRCEFIDTYDARRFISKNHIDGILEAYIYIGLYEGSELLSVMAFDSNKDSSNGKEVYRLVQCADKIGVNVVNGFERMFRTFTGKHNPDYIEGYIDLSKFIGEEYARLGFDTSHVDILDPGFIWTKPGSGVIVSQEMNTDDEMYSMGYHRVYDCGYARFTWRKRGD